MSSVIEPTALGEATIRELRDALRGELVLPADPGYDEARSVWNGMIDRRPALIARCAGSSDVKAAIGFARSEGLDIAVRGGSHNVAGNATCDRRSRSSSSITTMSGITRVSATNSSTVYRQCRAPIGFVVASGSAGSSVITIARRDEARR